VTISLANGETHEKFIRYPKGDPENPLSWEEMAAKFRALAGRVLPPERCERIIEAIPRAKPEAVARLVRI
jgi:2-methylcitrate dehydratase PrpD